MNQVALISEMPDFHRFGKVQKQAAFAQIAGVSRVPLRIVNFPIFGRQIDRESGVPPSLKIDGAETLSHARSSDGCPTRKLVPFYSLFTV
jgi:hypothetical protein